MTVANGPILSGLRIVEMSAFVAAPLGGATLAALGADVIRVDPPGGGIDIARWPLHNDASLYWSGLNQGKRSVTIDYRTEEGQRQVAKLIAAPGDGGGIFLSNLPIAKWNSFESLSRLRRDLIMVAITGSRNGDAAVDYTVNSALGFPFVTGPEGHDGPVNHVLPAWDAMAGYLAATGILAAERHRRITGEGQLVELSLADVGTAVAGHLGFLAEAEAGPEPRGRYGNYVYGTFGRDFVARDGKYLMVLALTPRQWRSLCEATELGNEFAEMERSEHADFRQEADRWRCRAGIAALLERWIGERDLESVGSAFRRNGVLWGPYKTFQEFAAEDLVAAPREFVSRVEHPRIGEHWTVGSPLRFAASATVPPQRSPALGEHTAEVIEEFDLG